MLQIFTLSSEQTLIILCCLYLLLLSQSSHYLRLISAQTASLPLKEFMCSGRALLALLEDVPYTLTPPTFALLILHWHLHLPLETSCAKPEVRPSDVLNEWQKTRNQCSCIKTRQSVQFSHVPCLSETVPIVCKAVMKKDECVWEKNPLQCSRQATHNMKLLHPTSMYGFYCALCCHFYHSLSFHTTYWIYQAPKHFDCVIY